MNWHSTAQKAPTHWVSSDLLDSGKIRVTVFEGATNDGRYVDLTIGDALDLADQINKQAAMVTA